ncbi:MAG: hypothetical protein ACO3A2_01180 [Bdellovibrionia bacterium]
MNLPNLVIYFNHSITTKEMLLRPEHFFPKNLVNFLRLNDVREKTSWEFLSPLINS